jgi:RNA polymerase sigma-70 factor (ECF subfamily)
MNRAMHAVLSDEELVAATQGGDTAAFDTLVRRWDKKIQGAIYRVMGSDEEARELSQEAFFKAYRALDGFERRSRFSSWLYQIAINLCRDRMRRRKTHRLMSLEDLPQPEAAAPLVVSERSVAAAIEERDLARIVAEAVAALPEEQREVIVLKEYEELTFAEIAEVLGLPVSTVKTRLYRALTQLRRQLERRGVRDAQGRGSDGGGVA